MFRKICVIGLGYIGLPTAAMFASRKIDVIGVDVDASAVDTINQGKIHIVEPDLDMVVHAAVTEGYLTASLKPQQADAFLVAVPTPFKEDKQPNLEYIKAASESIASFLKPGDLVVLESTSPVGATKQMAEWLSELRTDLRIPKNSDDDADISIAHCPERVLPGHVMRELVENDRVIGGMTQTCSSRAVELYKTFVQGECITTDCSTAEMAKLTENAFRDVNIAFANELSVICDRLDINVWELISIANRHPRVNILQPGPGVGGHCIAVDPWFIISKTPELATLTAAARQVNDGKPKWVLEQLEKALNKVSEEKGVAPEDLTIACLGLAFKPDIDDLRESPALNITKQVQDKHSGNIIVVEPNIELLPRQLDSDKVSLTDIDSALADSDVLLLLVDHHEFKAIKPSLRDTQRLVDTRGVWS